MVNNTLHGARLCIDNEFLLLQLGPRNCIGMRLGKLTTKIGLAVILSKFHLELSDKEMTDKELEFHPGQFVLTPRKPFNLKITKR